MYEETSTGDALSEHIYNFDREKKALTRSLKSFRLWLGRNQLYAEKVDQQISNLLTVLQEDYITVAFAGEFSRGKTELINAMFFASYGQRILPSQAGRTTMCPTELFFDQQRKTSYLRLLPIETRNDTRSLSAFRHLPDYWLEKPLNIDSADTMSETLRCVTETQMVNPLIAKTLGFNVEQLEKNADLMVEIPKWRHALVSFDHPLLKKGLCILDTPGLNALGSEPELTLGLLPRAQAVIFLLAADAGVTASDMAIWDEHISQLKNRPNLGLYAVLNKVDVLWDDLSSQTDIRNNIDKVVTSTARQLGLPKKDVIALSAQKGMLARVNKDTNLLSKSQINKLEDMLSESFMMSKEQQLWDNVIAEARTVVDDSLKMLENRRIQLLTQQDEMLLLKETSTTQIEMLLEDCRQEKRQYEQKALALKPSIRLMERQTDLLVETLTTKRLQQAIDRATKMIFKSKSTFGMLKGMREFFITIDSIMIEFCHEAELSNKMASSIYERLQREHKLEHFTPRVLTAKLYRQQLKNIIRDSDQFSRHLKLALSGKHRIVTRFFNTTVHNISVFFQQTENKLTHWSNNILHPLSHQIEDHKSLLETHINELKSMQKNGADASGRLRALTTLLNDIDCELIQCRETLQLLDQFKPQDKQNNILPFKKNIL